jgi:hypothetical protein|tara:strand:- start:31 stop:495 length:465 start_codon:yes stop_codon:yes gene_type:complete
MSDFPFSISSPHIPPTIFTLGFSQRVINVDQDGLLRVMPNFDSRQDIFFINLPFTFKVIGMSLSLDTDVNGGGKDYDFQLRTRPKDSATTAEADLTAAGDILSFDNVASKTSRSALFTDPQTITNANDVGLRVDSNTGAALSPEYGVILYCQTV